MVNKIFCIIIYVHFISEMRDKIFDEIWAIINTKVGIYIHRWTHVNLFFFVSNKKLENTIS